MSKPVTIALARAERGEPGAAEELWELVYQDLKQLASARLRGASPGQTLQATALVSEAWLRLGAGEPRSWQCRAHFFGAAALSMRNILVDQARQKQALRRNAGQRPATLEVDLAVDGDTAPLDMLALDEALTAFGREYERPAQVLSLRFFAGQSTTAIAEMLGVTPRTVDRELLFARTWLRRFLEKG